MAITARDTPHGDVQSLSAAAAPATGDGMQFIEELPTVATIQATKTATPTFSLVLEGSHDNVTYATLATLTDAGAASVATTVPFLRARLVSITGGGTVSAFVSASSGAKGDTGDTGPVATVVAGVGITVDETDTVHPVVSVKNHEVKFVTSDPSGAPAAGDESQFNTVNNKFWCYNGTAWKFVQLA